MVALVLLLTCALAFANGANDNGKGVATLVAFGAASAGQALRWAALTTASGAVVSMALAGGLVAAFRAAFVHGGEAAPPAFFAAVLVGAVGWVAIATRTGLPVSTTHAITGGLIGAGILSAGIGGIAWLDVGRRFAVPLLLGPLLALVAVYGLAGPLRRLAARSERRCLCVAAPVTISPAGSATLALPALTVGTMEACAAAGATRVVEGGKTLRATHWGACGLVGFARGWNDAPKISALALVALPAGQSWIAFALVTAAMAAGGLLTGRRVLATLAHKITAVPLGESLAASATAAILVALASWNGLPVSTTHVATAGIVGAGLSRGGRTVRWSVVREIAASWVVTLPAAALVAALGYLLLTRLG